MKDEARDSLREKETRVPLRRRVLRWALEIGVVLAIYFGVSHWQTRNLLGSAEQAPSFRLRSLDGSSVALEDFRGKRLLVHFWATWCSVCRREHAALNALQRDLGPDEALVSIVADAQDTDAVRRYATEHGITYPVLLADEDVIARYRVGAFPTNYFIDKDGSVSAHTVGMSTRFGMSARLGCSR